MRRTLFIPILLAVILAGCTPQTPAAETRAVEKLPPTTVAPLAPVLPTAESGYPEPDSAYPVPALPDVLPTAYPVEDAPPGDIDEEDLTSQPPEQATPQDLPSLRADEPADPNLIRLEDAIIEHVHTETGVPVEQIRVISAEGIVWPDGSLGCPAPDMMYTQALIEGMLITVEAAAQTLNYHTGGLEQFILCMDGQPASFGTAPIR